MFTEDEFSAPPSKRRRTSTESSRSSSPIRGASRTTLEQQRSSEKRDDDTHRNYSRSRSRDDSEDEDDQPKNGTRNHLPYRRRNRSRSSGYSRSSRSRSRSRSTSRSRSQTKTRKCAGSSQSSKPGSSPVRSPSRLRVHAPLSFKNLYTLSHAHPRGITSMKFSPDLSLLAVGSADASISIYSMNQPLDPKAPIKLLRTLHAHLAGINALAWSPVGPNYTLASASDDKSILLWSPLSSDFPISPSPLTGHSNYVYSLAFSPKGNMLVSGSYDEAVFLWDVRSARIMRRLPAHSDPVSGVDFLRDGSMVCSCAEDGLIRVWDSGTGQCLKTLVDEDRKPVTAVRFTPNGKFILAWTLDGCIRLWRYTEGTCVKTYQGHANREYSLSGSIGSYKGGQEAFVVSGSEDGQLVAWDVTSKEVLWRGKGHGDVVLAVDYGKLDDGRAVLVSAGKDRDIRLWVEDSDPSEGSQVNGTTAAAGLEDGYTDERDGGTTTEAGRHDPMLVDVNIRRTPGGDVEIEETDVSMRDGDHGHDHA